MAGSPRYVFPKRVKLRLKYTPSASQPDEENGDDSSSEPRMPGKPLMNPPKQPTRRRKRRDSGENNRPSPELPDEPIYFVSDDGGPPDFGNLLCYLALGFAPQPAPQHLLKDAYNCGLDALASSLAAVRNLIADNEDGIAEEDHLSAEDIRAMHERPEFEVEAKQFLSEVGEVDEETGEPDEEQLEHYLEHDELGVHQFVVLMRMINSRLGSHFNIGFITEGYRGRYKTATPDPDAATPISNDRIWDPSFIQPHEIYFQEQYRHAPTIWLHNTNAGTISLDQTQDQDPYFPIDETDPWQAMTPQPNALARKTVDGWNLLPQARTLVDSGLAMIRQTLPIANSDPDQNIYSGHFVTIKPTPPNTPTSGTAFVDIGCQGCEIPISNLRIIPFTPNTGLPTEPPVFRHGIPNFRILKVEKAPPKGGRGKYPVIEGFKIVRGELFLALPGLKSVRPKVRRMEGGGEGEVDNPGEGFMDLYARPWGLEGMQRFVAYPDGRALPLAVLERGIEGTDFKTGEVVLITGRTDGDDGSGNGFYCIRELGGDVAWVEESDLGRRVEEAFGLRFEVRALDGKLRMLTAKAGDGKIEESEEDKQEERPKPRKQAARKVVEEVPVPQAGKKKGKVEPKKGSKGEEVQENKEKAPVKKTGKKKSGDGLPPPKKGEKKTKGNEGTSGKKVSKRKADEDEKDGEEDGEYQAENQDEDLSSPKAGRKKAKISDRSSKKRKADEDEGDDDDEDLPPPTAGRKKAKTSAKKNANEKLPSSKASKKRVKK